MNKIKKTRHPSSNELERQLKIALLVIALFVPLTFLYFRNLKTHPFHIDEWAFIRKSYYFDLFFTKRDLKDPRWYTSRMNDEDDPEQPKIGTYIYGLTLHLTGVVDIEKTLEGVEFYHVERGETQWWVSWWNKSLVNLPPELIPKLQLVWSGRRAAVLFSLAGLVLLFLFGTKVKGPLYGGVAAFLLGSNSLMFLFGRRAMTDSMQLAFFFANLLFTLLYVKALKNREEKRVLLLSAALGVNAALGVGVKVSGMLIVIFLAILSLLLFLVHRRRKGNTRLLGRSTLIMAVSFLTVFILFHPYLHQKTIRHFVSMFVNRLEAAHDFRLDYPASAIYSRWEAAELILKYMLLPHGSYVNFRFRAFHAFPMDLLLFAAGVWLMGKHAFKTLVRKRRISGELIIMLWALVVIGGLVLYLKNNWPRYYLPSVSIITMIQAYAITTILHALWTRVVKQLRRARPD